MNFEKKNIHFDANEEMILEFQRKNFIDSFSQGKYYVHNTSLDEAVVDLVRYHSVKMRGKRRLCLFSSVTELTELKRVTIQEHSS